MLSFQQQLTDELLLHPFLLSSTFSILSLYFFIKWISKPHRNKPLPPSPPKLPILGNLHHLRPLVHRSFQSLATKYGPFMLFYFGSKPVILIQSADAAMEIMKTQDLAFADKPKSSTVRRLLYDLKDISVAPYGEYWRKLKSICVIQLLSQRRVQSFRFIREEETALLTKKIKSCCSSSSPVNMSELFMSLTNDVICRSAFGRKYSEEESGKSFLILLMEFSQLMSSLDIGECIPWLWWINRMNGFDASVDRVAKKIDDFLDRVIQEHLNAELENADNFVDILLQVYMDNSTGVSIDRENIKGIILDILIGGTDTTAATLEWAMTELLRHPIVMKKLQNEVREILGDRQDITDNDLEKMHYLKALVKETLRYHPPIPLLGREAREDVKVMGYEVAPGTMIITNAWAIGRDPVSWDEPEQFKPERFLNSSVDFKGIDFELLPFGAGRRRCPGIAFATASVELVLANLMQKFEWELPGGIKRPEDLDIIEHPGMTIHKKNPLFAVATHCYF